MNAILFTLWADFLRRVFVSKKPFPTNLTWTWHAMENCLVRPLFTLHVIYKQRATKRCVEATKVYVQLEGEKEKWRNDALWKFLSLHTLNQLRKKIYRWVQKPKCYLQFDLDWIFYSKFLLKALLFFH